MAPSDDVALDTTAQIETPEHVRFQVRISGPSRRGLAYLLDLLIRGAIVWVLVIILGLGLGVDVEFAEMSTGVMLLVLFVIDWGYYIFFETIMNGQTPGKKAVKLRVVKEGGYPVTFVDIVLRNLLRAADWLPLANIAGLIVMSFDSRFRRIGDLVAGTMVVSEGSTRFGTPLRITPAPSAAELESIPASATLSGAERDALELFLRRLGRLSPAREDELANIVAGVFAKRLGVRPVSASRFLAVLFVRAGGEAALPEAPAAPKKRNRWRR